MKLLKLLSMSILIASALLLNAAKNENGLPRNHQAKKTNSQSDKRHDSTAPIAALSNQPRPEPTPKPSYEYTYDYYYPAKSGPPAWFQELTTVVLIFFTGGLWLTSIWQWRAIARQANIAESIDAPYISMLIQAFILKSDGTPESDPHFTYRLKNDGRTQARILSVSVNVGVYPSTKLPEKPRYGTFANEFHDHFVVPAQKASNEVRYPIPSDFIDYPALKDHRQTCVFFGYVRYSSVFKGRPVRVYGYGYWFDTDHLSLIPVGGVEYNYEREEPLVSPRISFWRRIFP